MKESAPSASANSSCSGRRPATTISAGPESSARSTASSAIVPSPTTSTRMPGRECAFSRPVRTTADGSVSAASRSGTSVAEGVHEPRGNDDLIARRARARKANLVVRRADVRRSGAAGGAMPARDDPLGDAAHPDPDAGHALADRLDDARPLVAQNERIANERRVDARRAAARDRFRRCRSTQGARRPRQAPARARAAPRGPASPCRRRPARGCSSSRHAFAVRRAEQLRDPRRMPAHRRRRSARHATPAGRA